MIRTDANVAIATGHLMRTLTIARECLKRKETVCFVFSDEESVALFGRMCPKEESSVYRVERLFCDYRHPETELDALEKLLQSENPRTLLLDSYFVTPNYLQTIGQYTRVVYLDDLRAFDYPVDTVVNYDIIGVEERQAYRSGYSQARQLLLGGQYAPLREQFCMVPYQTRAVVENILITTGGTDDEDRTTMLIDAVLRGASKQTSIHVVIGALNRHRDRLRERAEHIDQQRVKQQQAGQKPAGQLKLYEGVSDMAALMSRCDIALSAAGTTLYELSAVGVPTICFSMAENQRACAEAFAASGAVIAERGDFAGSIRQLVADYPGRCQMTKTMRALIDGKGAARIAEELLSDH
jgi:UDP-2,4-diacetamido-2,4,6-trideoxy-beta-L-altropyranose hydrolase